MPSKRSNPPTQQERGFWRDVYIASHSAFVTRRGTSRSPAKAAALAADHADAAVAELRNRITWRSHP